MTIPEVETNCNEDCITNSNMILCCIKIITFHAYFQHVSVAFVQLLNIMLCERLLSGLAETAVKILHQRYYINFLLITYLGHFSHII